SYHLTRKSRPSGGGLDPQDFGAFISASLPIRSSEQSCIELYAFPAAIPLVVLGRSVTRQYHVPFDVVQHLSQFPVLVRGHFVGVFAVTIARRKHIWWIAIEQRLRCIVTPDDFLPRKVLDLHPTETLDHGR